MESLSLTTQIEEYIEQLLAAAASKSVSLRRKDLAEHFECVPSQINYVLRSRFAPENGFIVESQRGGHGYIRVVKMTFDNTEEKVNHIEDLIGARITEQESKKLLAHLQERKIISARERLLIEISLRNQEENGRSLFDISVHKRDMMRADLLKKMITSLTLS